MKTKLDPDDLEAAWGCLWVIAITVLLGSLAYATVIGLGW